MSTLPYIHQNWYRVLLATTQIAFFAPPDSKRSSSPHHIWKLIALTIEVLPRGNDPFHMSELAPA